MNSVNDKLSRIFGVRSSGKAQDESRNDRRSFIQKAGLGGLALGAFINSPILNNLENNIKNVNKI